ncbi:RNA-binding protein Hfq [Paraburkholderia ultramafica]|uniref:RNA-binding protein Hfq n=1 Tax=Paraburkholderia ultramafica TaxID=1544867 RepID=A0A6S7BCA3_9BURK|nr:RNA chaperone Hfq [Paraburkholderia ultramafica]CAB3795322.1 RNA-binding protein Hfq [Paraburkholderia ultramafica]
MALSPSVEDTFLQMLSRDKTTVSVFLKSGTRLTGKIESFDRYTVWFESPTGSQSIMKHAIATVLPGGWKPPARPASDMPEARERQLNRLRIRK